MEYWSAWEQTRGRLQPSKAVSDELESDASPQKLPKKAKKLKGGGAKTAQESPTRSQNNITLPVQSRSSSDAAWRRQKSIAKAQDCELITAILKTPENTALSLMTDTIFLWKKHPERIQTEIRLMERALISAQTTDELQNALQAFVEVVSTPLLMLIHKLLSPKEGHTVTSQEGNARHLSRQEIIRSFNPRHSSFDATMSTTDSHQKSPKPNRKLHNPSDTLAQPLKSDQWTMENHNTESERLPGSSPNCSQTKSAHPPNLRRGSRAGSRLCPYYTNQTSDRKTPGWT